jgi:hypothetical protein
MSQEQAVKVLIKRLVAVFQGNRQAPIKKPPALLREA